MGFDAEAVHAMRAILEARGHLPNVMVVRGSLIVQHRPDLEESIDPGAVYYVTREGISLVEDEEG